MAKCLQSLMSFIVKKIILNLMNFERTVVIKALKIKFLYKLSRKRTAHAHSSAHSPRQGTGQLDLLHAAQHPHLVPAQVDTAKIPLPGTIINSHTRLPDFLIPHLMLLPMDPAANRLRSSLIHTQKICRACYFDIVIHGISICANQKNLHFIWCQWSRHYWHFHDAAVRVGWDGLQLPKWSRRSSQSHSRPEKANDQVKTKLYHLHWLCQLPSRMRYWPCV